MAQYKDSEGRVYNERDLEVYAREEGLNFDDYLKEYNLEFDKTDYDDADFSDKLTSIGASTALGFVSFAEGLSDLKDG